MSRRVTAITNRAIEAEIALDEGTNQHHLCSIVRYNKLLKRMNKKLNFKKYGVTAYGVEKFELLHSQMQSASAKVKQAFKYTLKEAAKRNVLTRKFRPKNYVVDISVEEYLHKTHKHYQNQIKTLLYRYATSPGFRFTEVNEEANIRFVLPLLEDHDTFFVGMTMWNVANLTNDYLDLNLERIVEQYHA